MIREKLPFLAVFLILSALFVFPEEPVHVLQQGETLYSVARSYGVSLKSLLEVNGLSEEDARLVQAGRLLRIPGNAAFFGEGRPKSAEKLPALEAYRAEKGDTLWSIARRSGISVAELLEMNGLPPSFVLKDGDRLWAPSPAPAAAPPPAPPPEAPAPRVAAEPPKPAPAASSNAAPATAGSLKIDNSIRWPVRAKELSYLTGKLSPGVQVTGERSEPVRSLTQGTVISAGPYRGFGRMVIIQAAGGYQYVYGGCESLSVKEGDKVAPGAELGKLGIDTKTEKPQLIFLVYRNNSLVDPVKAPRS